MTQRESAILVMSDLHFGKETATYNPHVFTERLSELGQSLKRIHALLRGYQIDELVIAMLGDANDGTGIYPTQEHHQGISNAEQQADQLSRLLSKFLLGQQRVWGKVRVECVPGNHGRAGKHAHEAANWDIVTYRYLQKSLEDKGIPVRMNGDRADPFIRKIKVRGHSYVLYHGHDIRTFSNIPWYGMMLRLSRWLSTKISPFDVALMGHFHTAGTWDINRVRLFLSGTMVSDDDWALRTLGWESANKWWLFGVSDTRPVTWQYGVELK